MKWHISPIKKIIITGLLLALLATACKPENPENATAAEKIDAFAQTATARAALSGETAATALTAAVEATRYSEMIQSSQTAQTTGSDLDATATALAAAPMLAEIPLYGGNEENGRIGWIHPPVTLTADGYHASAYENQFPTVTGKDFIMVADITWESKYGSSGCGFILRADGDLESGSQYMVIASRGASGQVYFTSLVEGTPVNYRNIYANGIDPEFEWENGTTNRLAVAVRGNILYIYSNYTLIGEIDTTQPPSDMPNLPEMPQRPERPKGDLVGDRLQKYNQALEQYQKAYESYLETVKEIESTHASILQAYQTSDATLEEGFMGMIALTSSGDITCQFSNAWLWLEDAP